MEWLHDWRALGVIYVLGLLACAFISGFCGFDEEFLPWAVCWPAALVLVAIVAPIFLMSWLGEAAREWLRAKRFQNTPHTETE